MNDNNNYNINIPVHICLQYSALCREAETRSGPLWKQEVYAENKVIKSNVQRFQKNVTYIGIRLRKYGGAPLLLHGEK